MKIVAVRGYNLASLGEFAIEFDREPLASTGVIAMSGKTGVGKSTILDAICLALFDRTPRLGSRSTIRLATSSDEDIGDGDPRNLLRHGAASGWAEVDFVSNERQRYRSRWSVRRAHNRCDGALQPQELSLTQLDVDKAFVGKKTEVLAAIRSRIGLSFEQFCRSVLLAQGEFAAFLHSDAKAKGELLEKITGTAIYATLSKRISEKNNALERQVAAIQAQMQATPILDEAQRRQLETQLADVVEQRVALDAQNKAAAAHRAWAEHRTRQMAELEQAEADRSSAIERQAALAADVAYLAQFQLAERARQHWQRSELIEAKLAATKQYISDAEDELALIATNDNALVEQTQQLHVVAEQIETLPATKPTQTKGKPQALTLARVAAVISAATSNVEQLASFAVWQQVEAQISELEKSLQEHASLAQQLQNAETESSDLRLALLEIQAATQQAHQEHETAMRLAASFDEQVAGNSDELRRAEDACRQRSNAISRLVALFRHAEQLARQREELAAKLDRLQMQRLDAEDRSVELASLLGARQAVLTEVEHHLQQLQQTASLASHRALLVEGEPCPLCGAVEHQVQSLALIDELLVNQRKRTDVLREEVATLVASNSANSAQIAALDASLRRSSEQAQQLAELQQSADHNWRDCHRDLAMLPLYQSPREASSEWLDGIARQAADDLSTARAARDRFDTAQQARQQALGAAAFKAQQLSLAQQQQHRSELELSETTARVVLLGEQKQAIAELLSKQLADLRTSAPKLESLLIGSFAQIEERMQRDRPQHKALAALAADVESVRLWVAEHIAEGRRTREQLRSNREQWQRQLKQWQDSAVIAREELVREVELSEQVAAMPFAAIAAMLAGPADKVHRLQADIAAAQQEVAQADELCRERLRKLREHELAQPPYSDPPSADLLAESHSLLRRLEAQLYADRDNQTRSAELAEQIRSTQDSARALIELAHAIGSADGRSLRAFAQGLTLEILLEFANDRLAELAPRYSLERVPTRDLDVQLIDHAFAQEVRPVATLSGGETFLVCLALALGLASLTAESVSVQSLFIDEGFGTLDEESLEIALSLLDSLQANGQQVVVISHIAQIKERVAARIEVSKASSGKSKVAVLA